MRDVVVSKVILYLTEGVTVLHPHPPPSYSYCLNAKSTAESSRNKDRVLQQQENCLSKTVVSLVIKEIRKYAFSQLRKSQIKY